MVVAHGTNFAARLALVQFRLAGIGLEIEALVAPLAAAASGVAVANAGTFGGAADRPITGSLAALVIETAGLSHRGRSGG